ncbi:MAG: DUF4340 domain-containing protein [Phycisphaeraceae bacterium]|nr:DUF4340 domain-containing protein [Phycisphaeraceae bacterium]
MKNSNVLVLAGVAAAVVVAAVVVTRSAREETAVHRDESARLFPALGDRINDVASVTIRRAGKEWTVARKDGSWGLSERNGYPVQFEALKATLVGMADLRPVEPKTSKPESYSKIGVQDPGAEPATEAAAAAGGALITLRDDKGQELASLIVGTAKFGQVPEVFVRKAGEAQSWLAQGSVDVPSEPMAWVDRQIMNVSRERVHTASVQHPDGERLSVSRSKPETPVFGVDDVPQGRDLTSPSIGENLGGAITYLTLADVQPATAVDMESNPGPASEFRTFDGLVVKVATTNKDGRTWATFWAGFDPAARTPEADATDAVPEPTPADQPPPDDRARKALRPVDEVKKEAEQLNAKLSGWVFELPDYKAAVLTPRMEKWLKPTAPPPAASEPPTPLAPTPGG